MRKRIRVLLKSDAPLAISEGFRGEWAVPAKEYIPGSAVRGAIARYLIDSSLEEGLQEMKRLLLMPGTAVLDFHPVMINTHGINHNKEEKNLSKEVSRIAETGKFPLTAISCKRRPGFIGETFSDGLKKHGMSDSLETLLLKLLCNEKQIGDTRCEKCKERQELFEGWYQLEKGNGENQLSSVGVNPATSSYIHIGIDPDRGATTQGIFYTIDALDEEQFFLGAIIVDDHPEDWLKILKPETYLFLGAGKSRGYGAARIEVVQIESEKIERENESLLEPPEIRCRKFTERIRSKGGFVEEGSWLVPLTLLSSSIIMDRFLRPVLDDITKDVRDHGLPTTGKPILVKARSQTIQGWHSASDIPKPDFTAISSGSVFVYQSPANEQTVQALYRIEDMGIGFRRAEGFGRVRVASPLHSGILAKGK